MEKIAAIVFALLFMWIIYGVIVGIVRIKSHLDEMETIKRQEAWLREELDRLRT